MGPHRAAATNQKSSIFWVPQTEILTRSILYQIKGMNLWKINTGNAIALNVDTIGELTLYVPY